MATDEKGQSGDKKELLPGQSYHVIARKVGQGYTFGFVLCYDETNPESGFYISREEDIAGIEEGTLYQGDKLLGINNKSVVGVSHTQLMDMIFLGPDRCRLKLERGPFPVAKETKFKSSSDFVGRILTDDSIKLTVQIPKVDGKLGFSVTSYLHMVHDDDEDDLELYKGHFYICKVLSEAAIRLLNPGDEILSINGKQVNGLEHGEVVGLLTTSDDICTLELRRWPKPLFTLNEDED